VREWLAWDFAASRGLHEAEHSVRAGGTGQTLLYRRSPLLDMLVGLRLCTWIWYGRTVGRMPLYRCPLKLLEPSSKIDVPKPELVRADGTGGSCPVPLSAEVTGVSVEFARRLHSSLRARGTVVRHRTDVR
jgi:hypothetical protein